MIGDLRDLQGVAFRQDPNSPIGLLLATMERSEERSRRGLDLDRETVHCATDRLLDDLEDEARRDRSESR